MEEQKGLVVEVLGPVVFVQALENERPVGQEYACSLLGKRYKAGRPVVGDEVAFVVHTQKVAGRDYQGVINDILPRRSLVERLDPGGGRAKALVANLDLLVVVASVGAPALSVGLIDRYLVCAHHWGIEPIICLSKWELAEEIDNLYVQLYEALGYRCLRTSAHQNEGLDDLRKALTGHSSAFLGHSGVGKSTILNVLFPDAHLPTAEISRQSQRGRHTTSASRLLPFENGGFVIDTPGVREFGIVGIKSEDLSGCFPEFAPFIPQCRFQPCSHTHEPGCAVARAVEEDQLPSFRFQSYQKILAELKEAEKLY